MPVRDRGPRLPLALGLCALAALDLTCARPIASGAAGSPAGATTAAAGAEADDQQLAPLPAPPKPPSTVEHAELRPTGKIVARHVERGFETLIVSTGEHVRCDNDRLEGGAEVRIQGASDTRKPWSTWLASLPGRGGDGNGAADDGVLVV